MMLVAACASTPKAPGTPAPVAASTPAVAPAAVCPPALSVADTFPGELAANRGYRLGAPSRMTPTEDGRSVLFLRTTPGEAGGGSALWITDVATGTSRELLRPEAVLKGAAETLSPEEKARRERARVRGRGFTSFEASKDGAIVLLSLSGRLHVLETATAEVRELPTGEGVIDPRLSPDGKRVAYVRDFDVHVLSLSGGAPSAVTRGGTELRPRGLAEFMAQEEFYRYRGFWWSPDGNELLVQETDSSPVPEWTYADPAFPDRPARTVRYPRVGAPHAIVGLTLHSVHSTTRARRAPRRVTWDSARYPYLTNVTWSRNAPPTIVVHERRFQHAAVLAIDVASGATRTLVTEEDTTWLWPDPSVPGWLPDGSGFVWSTERHGGKELELRDREGALVASVAPPELGARGLLAIDGERGQVYFTASTDPPRAEVWAASLDGKTPPRVVARAGDGILQPSFGASTRVFAYTASSASGAPRYGVRDVDGKELASIPSAARTPPWIPKLELTTVGPDAVRVAIIRPRAFQPGRRYPVIDNVYGAPINNMVRADAYHYFEQQWLADAVDAIVVTIDARGTGWRDRAWQRAFYKHYGDLPVDGHADALALLAAAHPEMDAARLGIYGWSNGGYVSTMAILRRPEVFKVAVAGAPVADLRDYDAIMEAFFGPLGDPSWDEASLLTWAAKPPTAERPARPLLLIHGTADDNVYVAHALKLAAAMGLAGRPVDFMPLVEQTHMVSAPDTAAAMSRRIAAHFRRVLHEGCAD